MNYETLMMHIDDAETRDQYFKETGKCQNCLSEANYFDVNCNRTICLKCREVVFDNHWFSRRPVKRKLDKN